MRVAIVLTISAICAGFALCPAEVCADDAKPGTAAPVAQLASSFQDFCAQWMAKLDKRERFNQMKASKNGKGEYTAYDGTAMKTYELFPGPHASLEHLLRSAGSEVMALDLRSFENRTPLLHRNIGLFPADLGFYRTVVQEGFHALLFVDSTTATKPIGESR